MKGFAKLAAAVILCVCIGCGTQLTTTAEYPFALRDADGNQFVLDDLREIANDDDLTDNEKREAFRELGIGDEEVIDVLMTL